MQHISILFTPQCPFLSPLPPTDPSPDTHMHSCPIIIVIIIIIIILGLGSTNEWEHGTFGLLSLADNLQFHPFFYKSHNFIYLYG
jgi:hypothetical protein